MPPSALEPEAALVAGLALVLVACGGPPARPDGYVSSEGRSTFVAAPNGGGGRRPPTARADDEAILEVDVGGNVPSYLSSVQAVVETSDGAVLGGAEQGGDGGDDQPLQLSLVLPAGVGYTLRLSATTADAQPTTCRANVGPLALEGGAVATVLVLAWECGPRTGYVPSMVGSECFWLADWSFVSRRSARVGQEIAVSASGHDAAGALAHFDWSTTTPGLGTFVEPGAAKTSFRCTAVGEGLSLTVTISDDECQKRLSHRISCL